VSKYLILIIVLMGGLGYWYYTDSQKRIKILTENNAKLEVANKTNQETINTLQADSKKFSELNSVLQKQLQESEAYGDELRGKLRKHNLTALSEKKPALVEGKINDATKKVFEEIEKETGFVQRSVIK